MVPPSPCFSIVEAQTVARESYRFDAVATELPSYDDQNFLLEDASGRRRVLKVANRMEDENVLCFENSVIECAARVRDEFETPRVCSNLAGASITQVDDSEGRRHNIRLLTYIEGVPWSALQSHSPELQQSLGRLVGVLTRALEEYARPVTNRFTEWDLKNFLRLRPYVGEISSAHHREILERIFHRFENFIAPCLSRLTKSVIHGDVNNDNVLVRDGRVAGLIDFGDAIHTARVFEIAIAMGYAMLGSHNPLATAGDVLRGCQAIRPLDAGERAVVFDLARVRVAMSVTFATHYGKRDPDNSYLTANVVESWRVLEKLDDELF